MQGLKEDQFIPNIDGGGGGGGGEAPEMQKMYTGLT